MKPNLRAVVALVAATVASSCGGGHEQEPLKKPAAQPGAGRPVEDVQIDPNLLMIFKIAPATPKTDNKVTAEKVALGRRLYHDKHLSKGGDIACASCHSLDTYGVDNQPTSPGTGGAAGDRNTPSTFNAARHFVQFWDGRAVHVEEQALGPVLNPSEHGVADEAELVRILKADAETVGMFQKAFPGDADPVTPRNFASAIGAFERTLVTRGPWEEYLAGRSDALTPAQKRGLKAFIENGCTACHNTELLGGNMYQKSGLLQPYPSPDPGRFRVTNNESDRGMFKVPSLLNVAKTAPYFHDGKVATLEEAVALMGKLQLGRDLPEATVADIVTFLKALTGTLVEPATRLER